MAQKNVKSEKQKLEKVIYLGPSLKKYGISYGQIFEGEHKNVEMAKTDFEGLENLFVKVDKDLALKKARMAKQGTRENILYKDMVEKLKGGK